MEFGNLQEGDRPYVAKIFSITKSSYGSAVENLFSSEEMLQWLQKWYNALSLSFYFMCSYSCQCQCSFSFNRLLFCEASGEVSLFSFCSKLSQTSQNYCVFPTKTLDDRIINSISFLCGVKMLLPWFVSEIKYIACRILLAYVFLGPQIQIVLPYIFCANKPEHFDTKTFKCGKSGVV